eukprot:TRINITY_DN16562_c0_g1_i2.p1 TRINITY_DN16562_c0_g1~~TRINITY_DN16562_c0_g1_i2.p1  ORF type:complete len:409 (+),score=122.91 TRINITY_DN16562_c0_g1_i2:82-1227(+)
MNGVNMDNMNNGFNPYNNNLNNNNPFHPLNDFNNNNHNNTFSTDSPKRKREDEEPIEQRGELPPSKLPNTIASPPMLRPRSLARPVLSSAPVRYTNNNTTNTNTAKNTNAHIISKPPTTSTVTTPTTTTSTSISPSLPITVIEPTFTSPHTITSNILKSPNSPIKADPTIVLQNGSEDSSKVGTPTVSATVSAPPKPNPFAKLALGKGSYTPPILTAAAKAAMEKANAAASSTTASTPTIPSFITLPVITPEKAEKNEKAKLKSKAVYRKGGGQEWVDPSLADWPENDYRIFVGDLGNEVTDDMLKLAFQRYTSLQRVKVIRDKKTTKSKGFGFVSFGDPHDFIKAMREMNGKYIGNRPCKLRKSNWEKRMDETKAHGKKH